MAIILNIETSSKYCSISLSEDGRTFFEIQDTAEMNHAVNLAPFAKEAIDFLKTENMPLDAVSVSMGPGSYTGLRIGLSFAKGLAFSRSIPLIGIDTLQLIAVKAMFADKDWVGDEIIVPMIDARRMEVYSGVFDATLKLLKAETPEILDEKSFNELWNARRVLFAGDGAMKFKNLYNGNNAVWMDLPMPTASDMSVLSERAFLNSDFIDPAYSVPNYLKEYQTTKPKSKIIENK